MVESPYCKVCAHYVSPWKYHAIREEVNLQLFTNSTEPQAVASGTNWFMTHEGIFDPVITTTGLDRTSLSRSLPLAVL